MKALAHLNKYLLKYKKALFAGVFFIVVSNFFVIYPAKYVGKAMDEIIRLLDGNSIETSTIWLHFLIIVGATLLNGLFKFFMRQTIIVTSRKIEYDLKNEVFRHYLTLSPSFFLKNKIGDLMNRVSEDVTYVRLYLGPGIMYTVNLSVLIAIVSFEMFRINVEMTLYLLIPLPILAFLIYRISRVINKKSADVQRNMATVSSVSQQMMTGVRIIKNFGLEDYVLKKFGKVSNHYRLKNISLTKTHAMFIPMILLLIGISSLSIFYVGGKKVVSGEITPGVIAEFLIYLNVIIWPVASIGWVTSLIQRAAVAQTRINEFLSEKSDIQDKGTFTQTIRGDIQFKNLAYTVGETSVFHNLNLHIRAGESVAILGQVGSGKTTLANLLQRLIEPQSGEIRIGDRSLDEFPLKLLRQSIGYVSQEVFLFSDTIENNIQMGNEQATKEQIIEAAKKAKVHHNIINFKDGYQTVVGEQGVMLSGGQKQRITLARALVSNPEILLLDDSLSAVDTKTEQIIIQNLKAVMKNRTTIVITHRASITKHCDKIIVLDKGQVAEQGSFQELIAKEGLFYQIAQLSD